MSYRQEDYNRRNIYGRSPPPPPPEMPPLSPNTRPGHLGRRDSSRTRNEFSFRNNDAAPQYPRETDSYRPGQRDGYRHRRKHQTNPNRNREKFASRVRVATASRPLLSVKQSGIEQTLGMSDDLNTTKHFLMANDMSDSEEEQMEESESDNDETAGVSLIKPSIDAVLENTTSDIVDPPAKRRAFGLTNSGLESETDIPKWSNPDPYTVLPPTNEARKRKDVVKLIRKARIVTEKGVVEQNQVAANDDFISFGYGDELATDEEEGSFSSPLSDAGIDKRDVPKAPLGPKGFSHLQHLRDQDFQSSGPPGVGSSSVSANIMGPPPGLVRDNPGMATFKTEPMQDAALGNRKRTHDDRIKSTFEPTVKRKARFSESSIGSLTEDWFPTRNVDPTPWVNDESNFPCENAGFRLHKEICDFYEFVRPRKYEQSIREDLLERLQAVVRNRLQCQVHCFGSFAAGLYLPNADMDLVVVSNEFIRFAKYLRNASIAQADSIEVIVHAKVPLIKFVDLVTGIRVDISFENMTGLVANETFCIWKRQFPAMPILVTVIKQFLMMRGLNEVVNGGLGGFSAICLVTSLLQNMPRVQSGELVPEHHLGEMLIEFLDFYGNQLDTSRTGIMMSPPGYFAKNDPARNPGKRGVYQANKTDRLAIMDPNMPENDISGGSRNVMLIFDCFSQAHEDILGAMRSSKCRSLLEWPLGGNYQTFTSQRNYHRKLFEQRWGTPPPGTVDLHHYSHPKNGLNIDGSTINDEDLYDEFDQKEQLRTFPIEPFDPRNIITRIPSVKTRSQLKKHEEAMKQSKLLHSKTNKIPRNDSIKKIGNSENLSRKAMAAERRSKKLKEEYPDISGIPDKISCLERKNILERKIILARNTPGALESRMKGRKVKNVEKKKAEKLETRKVDNTDPKKVKAKKKKKKKKKNAESLLSLKRRQPLPFEIDDARRMEVARALGVGVRGMSNNNPISID